MELISVTMWRILKVLRHNQGELPKSEQWGAIEANFSHGGSSAIPLLTSAMKLFPDMADKLLNQAQILGEIVWKQVLIKQK